MKKQLQSITLALIATAVSSYGAAGIFDSFAIVNTASNTYYDIGATTGNPDFQGTALGTFDATSDNLKLGGQTKTFKNNGTDVTGAKIYYRVWSGSESGTFSNLSYAFQINISGGDQQWGTDVAGSNATAFYTPNLLTGLSNGNYTLEVYTEITTNGVNAGSPIASNNSGNNFEATFTVVPEPSVALLSLFGLGVMAFRRRA